MPAAGTACTACTCGICVRQRLQHPLDGLCFEPWHLHIGTVVDTSVSNHCSSKNCGPLPAATANCKPMQSQPDVSTSAAAKRMPSIRSTTNASLLSSQHGCTAWMCSRPTTGPTGSSHSPAAWAAPEAWLGRTAGQSNDDKQTPNHCTDNQQQTCLQLGQLGKHGRIGQSGEEGAHSSRHPPQLKRWVCCQGLAGRGALFLHGWELGPNASDAINEACGRTGLARLTAPQHIQGSVPLTCTSCSRATTSARPHLARVRNTSAPTTSATCDSSASLQARGRMQVGKDMTGFQSSLASL